MKKQNGFTLVEIAIVLVVIGLLLGGVLKGQELLENGRIRKALNDFNTIAAATFTYQDRYRELPGDDDQATRFAAATPVGDGNGLMGDDAGTPQNWNSTTADDESRLFWLHLRLDGLVERAGQDQPDNAFNGISGVMYENFGITNEHVICMDNVTVKSAVIMDTRIDDGVSNTGVFAIFNGDTTGIAAAASAGLTVATAGRGAVCREL